MLAALFLLACTPDDATPAVEPLPQVWGLPEAKDYDPDPDVVEIHLDAYEGLADWVDGEKTDIWTYNGTTPGPLIHARLGNRIRVEFTNYLEEETTVHWHGLRIPDTMDGVPMIQDPIEPGGSFEYDFVPPDSGSYWYHPHVMANEQVERGLQGALVIHEASPPPMDRERYFVVDDVKIDGEAEIADFSLSGMEGMMGRYGNLLLVNGYTDILQDDVRPGGHERWRIVNTANARTMWAEVNGAQWRVIAVDGTLLPEPFETDRITLPIGRRYDLEVVPDPDAQKVELVMLQPGNGDSWSEYPMFEGIVDADEQPGTGEFLDWSAPALPEMKPTEQDLELELGADSTGFTINGQTYEEGDMIPVAGDTPTRITVTETTGMSHPLHMHGNFFQVVSRNGDPADEPGLQDTVLVDPNGSLELYSGFENPGLWMAHCHILEHAELGMMTTLDVMEPPAGE